MNQPISIDGSSEAELDSVSIETLDAINTKGLPPDQQAAFASYLTKRRRSRRAVLAGREVTLDAIAKTAEQAFFIALAVSAGWFFGAPLLNELSATAVCACVLVTALVYVAALLYRYRGLRPIISERAMLGEDR